MQAFIDAEMLENVMKGSHEKRAQMQEAAAISTLGDSAVLIASFDDHSVFATEETAYRVEFSDKDGKIAVESHSPMGGVVVTEESSDVYVAGMLSDMVEAIISGKDIRRNRLRDLSAMIESKSYWISDYSVPMIEQLSAPSEWKSLYSESKADIRKELRGSVKVIESKVPRSKYGKLALNKLPEYKAELDESFAIMLRLLDEVAGNVSTLEISESLGYGFSVDVAKAVADEARSLEECGKAALRLAREKDLSAVAEIHDTLAGVLKDLVIVEEFLVRSSQAPTPTEKKNATQS